MTLLEAALNAMVAGVKAGAGADEVVLVRDCGDRDLSRNSTIDYNAGTYQKLERPIGSAGATDLGVLNCLVATFNLRAECIVEGDNERGYCSCLRSEAG